MYLGAAKMVVGDEFHYIKEVASGHHAVLEFETKVDGKYVNGIDMITCDENGQITEFKVMIRPLQAVNMMHDKMKEMIKQMMPQGPPKRSSL
eukprot:CAMPEP_0175816906 /NCGR_PEP_ID=MMETSP0107_2-20121207/6736_1 /TAXON_ID=195067 ORGANISM="Goniomonas pacifica, Strain CCMP1869" /NCGR_SAMPLE_ID=MMETSP0107_2 /ASSEMBLY_ACC=CAM_ASM_000203 /LENGTH=91 /DNA_ID=CAMNT_0017129019 /DNA_START=65 /DNA_END=340 /DNA_ORIENTATION=+